MLSIRGEADAGDIASWRPENQRNCCYWKHPQLKPWNQELQFPKTESRWSCWGWGSELAQSIGWCQPAWSEEVNILTHRSISSVITLTGSHMKIPLSVICISFDPIKLTHTISNHVRERQYFFKTIYVDCDLWKLQQYELYFLKEKQAYLKLRVLKEVFPHCYSWLDLVTMVMPT